MPPFDFHPFVRAFSTLGCTELPLEQILDLALLETLCSAATHRWW